MAKTRWLTEPEMRAWRGLIRSTWALQATLDAELQDAHGLTLAEYEVLVLLSEAEGGALRMTDLAAQLHISPSGATRRVDLMVRQGMICRRRCETDRRGSFAVLTDDGWKRLREAAPTHVRGVREHFVDRLSERQLANLAAAFDALTPEVA